MHLLDFLFLVCLFVLYFLIVRVLGGFLSRFQKLADVVILFCKDKKKKERNYSHSDAETSDKQEGPHTDMVKDSRVPPLSGDPAGLDDVL